MKNTTSKIFYRNSSASLFKILKRFYETITLACLRIHSFRQLAPCDRNLTLTGTGHNNNNNASATASKMKIKIGNSTFTATLYDNAAAAAFKAMLPLKVNMTELNGNEKYVELPRNLTTKASNPETIQAGDLMLYGSSTLVLFYKTFSTSYNYTQLARIDDSKRLAAAVGSGNVSVTFELQ